ncbi:MAG TPA: DUF6519 domain-containing protein, partial [Bryobacteraceae bacterium]
DRDRLSFDPRQQYRSVVAQQGRVMVPADFNEAQEIAGEEQRAEARDFVGPSGTPDNGYAIIVPAPSAAFDFGIGEGSMYVGGLRVHLSHGPLNILAYSNSYFTQPDWLDPSPVTNPLQEYIYLQLREREISAVEDPTLKDVALGGPDTTQRTRIVQRIERRDTTASNCDDALAAQQKVWQAGGETFDPDSMRLTSLATLQVSFDTSGPPPTPCDPVAQGGYLGAENQLIRVRISGKDKFVWGFDNSSFLYRVTLGSDKQTLTFDAPPVDSFHFPEAKQVVEVLRTTAKLPDGGLIAADVGQLFKLDDPYVPETQSVKLPVAYTASAGTPQLFLRVWKREVQFTAGTPAPLEGTGVLVTLKATGGVFHIGDFWAFAVRPFTPNKIYPQRYFDGPQPPEGPRQWVCPLAIIGWTSGVGTLIADCRNRFDDLVTLTKRKTGASCCTVLVKPEDLKAGVTLQTIIDQLPPRSTLCLQPGAYPLFAPLLLTSKHDGLTIEACNGAAEILKDPHSTASFLDGMVVLRQAHNVTIRGLRFLLPPVQFPGVLAGYGPAELAKIVGPDLSHLQTAIGIRLANSLNFHIEDCEFFFQTADVLALFEAGIFAMDNCSGLVLKNNEFRHQAGQPRLPALPPGNNEVRFGFLMVPSITKLTLPTNLVAGGSQLAPQTPLREAVIFAAPAPTVDAVTVAATLDDGLIQGNVFFGLTSAALIYADLGDVRVESNTVRGCYSGIQLYGLKFRMVDPALEPFSSVWWDFPFAVGSAIGQGFPFPQGFTPSQTIDVKAAGVFAFLKFPSDRLLLNLVNLNIIYTSVHFSGFSKFQPAMPISIVATANDMDTVLKDVSTGCAFVFWGEVNNTDSRVVVSANSLRGRVPFDGFPVAAVMWAKHGSITGNLILNEANDSQKRSLIVGPLSISQATLVAVTGNTMLGQPILPLRDIQDKQPPPFDRWDPMNLITP